MSQEIKQNEKPSGLLALPVVKALAISYELSPEAFVFTFKNVAMPTPHTDAEFVSCCLVAKEHGLNPLTKEIYFMKTRAGQIQPIVSVDGWVRKCNEHPKFDGMKFHDAIDENGGISAITCTIFRKDRTHPTEVTEYLEDCLKVGGPVWKTSPRRMLRHRALTQAARYAFGFAGVMDRDEFDQWQAMRDITPKAAAPLEIPDDDEVAPKQIAQEVIDEPLADSAGQLAKIAEDIALCSSMEELAETEAQYADIIPRLSKSDQKKANKLFGDAKE